MMMSPTSDVTMAPNAAPMMTPTARSITLPRIANFLNSSHMGSLRSDSIAGGVRHRSGRHQPVDLHEPSPHNAHSCAEADRNGRANLHPDATRRTDRRSGVGGGQRHEGTACQS